jgi:ATP-NAD kinase N-terminal domain
VLHSSPSGTVGIIANPAAGKDVRRLVSHASPTSDAAKIGVVKRAVLGAIGGGATRILVAPDRHNLGARAVADLSVEECGSAIIEMIDAEVYGFRGDTVMLAERFAKESVDALIVLGGDGTNRDVAKGWLDAPLISISTGTNNVFPRALDATLAGLGAGLVASGVVARDETSFRAKAIHVTFDDGSPDDLALVDLALIDAQFTGSRAVWDPSILRTLIACIAEPASVGLSSLAGLLRTVDRRSPGGVHVDIAAPGSPSLGTVRALLAPGMMTPVRYSRCDVLVDGASVALHGPAMLAFDGERDRELGDGVTAHARIRSDGPIVIDTAHAITLAAERGFFHAPPTNSLTPTDSLPPTDSLSPTDSLPQPEGLHHGH